MFTMEKLKGFVQWCKRGCWSSWLSMLRRPNKRFNFREKKIKIQVNASNNIFFAIKLIGIFIILVEMSDQNFVDEDIKGEKASSSLSSKKMKTLKTDASGSDQVVPHGKPPVAEEVTEECTSAEK
ncbi:hypothetical protein NC653_034049 [Populus alba x Populus x berolinensis]|uniref:Uncharacterized protein n=1 Tax=Populus alba x Populus x berolinensis TaxID=444605 RepID=A0AAD6LV55_9ROSI|nr:hypothetical protein NC653_034049 [Populus alba x Populus x berolinensis]